ncbi:creatinine amidohydrolase [Glaciihabitans tibetensis]|uniref:Creatinine amidohydrolase n=1 Tax=Glaciihabitans tibetensis TaxID=1266600 RepID=A0A2T0VF42_9MICO|nr:creatininase family protein [Glaciihabitans tibetensis]PRY68819.1 creatinine amidohydrolase [Glaciihabitans tibetensis]
MTYSAHGGWIDAANASWPEFAEALRAGAIPLLPFGAHEQHGPHLPLQTDSIMAEALARRVAIEVGGALLPVVAYGETSNNAGFPGTLSLSFETVRAIATDIGSALAAQGARGFVIVNGDFGNQAPLKAAARALTSGHVPGVPPLPTLVVDYPGFEEAAARFATTLPAGPGFYHADEVETSIVLAVRPEAVHMDKAEASYPDFPDTYPSLFTQLQEISPSGVFGDPRPATPETGEAILAALTLRAVDLVQSFLRRL